MEYPVAPMGGDEISRKYEPQRRGWGGWTAELARDGACVAVLAGIVVVLILPALPSGRHFLGQGASEAALVSYPAFSYLHDRVHHLGEVPLWNPYVAGGTPFLGNATAPVFSPANVALLAADPLRAYTIAGAILVWFAGLFMYVFLRVVQLGRHAALTGGAWYMLSAMVMGNVSDLSLLSGPAFLPLVVASFALAFQRNSLGWTGSAALCWGILALSTGLHADLCVVGTLILLAFTFSPVDGAALASRLAKLVVGLGVGSALAGIQLLPAFGAVEFGSFPVRYAGSNHVSLATLATLVAPGMIRNPSGISLWVGSIGLLFAFLSVRLRAVYWVKYLWALVVIVVGGLVLLRVPALQEAASRIPRFYEVQQARALFLCVFALAGLAAIRLDCTLSKDALDVERSFGMVVALLLAVVVGGLLVLRDADASDQELAEWIVGEDWHAAVLVGSAAVVAALFWMGTGAVRWLVLPLAVIELSIHTVLGMPVSGRLPRFLAEELPADLSAELRAKGNAQAFLPNTLLARRVRDVNGIEAPIPRAYRTFMQYVEYGRETGFDRGIHVTRNHSPLLALAGVQYAWEDEWREVGADRGGDPKVSRVDACRAYYANLGVVALDMSDTERLARLESLVGEGNRPVLLDDDIATGPLELETGAIEFVEDHPERIRLRTHAGAARLLVLADNWAPGWTATVDDQEVQIRRVNLWMRGVEVPAGVHDVRFTYRCVWAERGLVATAVGALGVAVLWLLALRRPVVQPIG